jgi:hypothetical protein
MPSQTSTQPNRSHGKSRARTCQRAAAEKETIHKQQRAQES